MYAVSHEISEIVSMLCMNANLHSHRLMKIIAITRMHANSDNVPWRRGHTMPNKFCIKLRLVLNSPVNCFSSVGCWVVQSLKTETNNPILLTMAIIPIRYLLFRYMKLSPGNNFTYKRLSITENVNIYFYLFYIFYTLSKCTFQIFDYALNKRIDECVLWIPCENIISFDGTNEIMLCK